MKIFHEKNTCHQGVNLSRDLYMKKENVSNTNLIDGENIARKKKVRCCALLHVNMHDG